MAGRRNRGAREIIKFTTIAMIIGRLPRVLHVSELRVKRRRRRLGAMVRAVDIHARSVHAGKG